MKLEVRCKREDVIRLSTSYLVLIKKEIILKKLVTIILILLVIILCANFDKLKNHTLKKIYKTDYSKYVEKYSKEYEVDKYLIYATIKAESNFNPEAKSSQGAIGLMQLLYSTAEEIAPRAGIEVTEENIYDPEININLGTKLLSILIQKYGNNELALAAYNAGPGNVDSWISKGTLKNDGTDAENIPFTETNNYVRKILRDYKIYLELYK